MAVAAAATAQVCALATQLQSAGFSAVSVMSKRGPLAPLRTVLYYKESSKTFDLIPVLSLVEPPIASALEISKLTSFPQVTYTSSRNRQWHIYSLTERSRPQAPALRRLFLRGLVRQLGRPDLVTPSASRNAADMAGVAMDTVLKTLEGALTELERIGNTPGT